MTAPPSTPVARRESLREWETLMRRYPLSSPWGLAWQGLTTLSSNLVIAWLVVNERLSPLELVFLVALEAILLVLVAWVQSRFVPKEAIKRNAQSVGQQIGTLLFGLFWLGAVYTMVLGFFVSQGEAVQRLLADPLAFVLSSNIKWPLLITLAGATVDALQDHAHFGKHGGIFLSTAGLQGMARWLTLFLGGIPFFMPLVAVVGVIVAFGTRVAEFVKRRGGGDREAIVLTALMPVLSVAFFATFGWLVQSDVSGWAAGYVTAKFAAEIFVVCLPLIAKKAHAEESAGIFRVKGKKVKMRVP
jgi:hypothetical protein